MPQVPYDPSPNVAPQANPTPYRSGAAPADAFGANIARATEGLGKAIEGAGNEIFARALSMQELNQQAEANEAIANYQMRLGESHADYHTSMGKNAVDGLNPFIKSTEDLRVEVGKGLGSDYARKVYDSATRNTRSRTIFSAASHAATENKRYVVGASDARIGAANSSALQSPADEAQFKSDLGTVESEVNFKADISGASPDQRAQMVADARSKLWVHRIQGLAKEQPFTAGKLLEKAVKDGDIKGEDIGKITEYVNKQRYTVGARQISQEVNSGNSLKFGDKQVDIKDAQRAIGQFESGGNYSTIGPKHPKYGRALGKYQVMESNLPEWLGKAGLPQMSAEEFLKSPDAQDQVFNTIFGGYMKQYGSFNEAASRWFTGRGVQQASAAGAKDVLGTSVQKYLASTNAILARSAPVTEKVAAGKARAAELAPDDPMMADYTEQRIITDNNRENTLRRDEEFRVNQTVEAALVNGNEKGDMPTTVEELKATSPEVEAAWNASKPSKQRQWMSVLARNAKGDTQWTEESLREYQKQKGVALSDPAKFLDTDVIGLDLPISARKELINLQGKLKKNAEADPRVTRAMGILMPDLQAAGISKKNNADDYALFVGSLQDALQQWSDDNKKQPGADDVRKIGARVMQTMSGSGWFGTNIGASRFYQVPVPSTLIEQIKSAAEAQGLPPPTDAQIQREYTRQQYEKLYSKGSAKPDASSKPSVPMSK